MKRKILALKAACRRHWRTPGPWLVYASLVVITIVYFLPYLDSRNYFIGDDFVWLYQAQFGRFVPTLGPDDFSYERKYGAWAFIYQIIPMAVYNDRLMGVLFIKSIYDLFGMSPAAHYVALLALHVANVVLFHRYARLFLSVWPSWVAAALAGTWFYAIDAASRVNSVFDVLAFTFALISMLLFRRAVESGSKVRYLLSLLAFFLAVRSKEYALGVVLVLFVQEILLFEGGLKGSLRRVSGFMLVSVLVVLRYAQLYLDKSSEQLFSAASDYRLAYDVFSPLKSLYWYWAEVFYKPFISPVVLGLVFSVFVLICVVGGARLRRVYLFSAIAFATLLGPVLLFAEQRAALYLYAPHFFVALALAAALEARLPGRLLGILLIVFVSAIPFVSDWKRQSTEWMLARRGEVHAQLESGLPILGERLKANNGNLAVFVSGVKPYVNAYVNAWAVWNNLPLSTDDLPNVDLYVLGQHTTVENDKFMATFCGQTKTRLYLEYVNDVAHDRTQDFAARCR